jgi:soluble lytic murein transglycosylase-like protein
VENATLISRSRSRAGATGVMQVMPRWKRDIHECGDDLHEVRVNVCFGTRILRIALDQSTSVRQALLRYNGCVRAARCHRYASAVFSQAGRALLLSRALSQPRATSSIGSAAAPGTGQGGAQPGAVEAGGT